jgi:2-(1,2-epoxy-1,2-dihydrophenyl)acetyl-CoA isomerase
VQQPDQARIEPNFDSGSPFHAIGRPGSLEMIKTGEPVAAEKALLWGMINECLEDAQLQSRARDWAEILVQGPTRALVMTRQLVDEGTDNSFEDQYRRELETNRELRESRDGKEGVLAFLEKRPAQFREE